MIIKGYSVFCDDCELEFQSLCKEAALNEQKHHFASNEGDHRPFVTEVNFYFENAYADTVSMTRRGIASKMTGASD